MSWTWPGRALDRCHGDVAGEVDLVGQQNAERGAAERDVAGLAERRVVEDELAVGGDEEERGRGLVLEAHAAGALEPGGALRDGAVARDLHEAGLEGFEAVQIGLDSGDVGLVLRGEGDLGCGSGRKRQQGGGG